MPTTELLTQTAKRLPRFAAIALVCCILGLNTHVDAANSLLSRDAVPEGAMVSATSIDLPKNMQVLSPKDADLYRAAFAAQQSGDWKSADVAIAGLADKRLIGHVLADRYMRRRTNSATELHDWLAAYGSLPEANDIFNKAKNLPNPRNLRVIHPTLADAWTGTDTGGSSLGFRTGSANRDALSLWNKGLDAWRDENFTDAGAYFEQLAATQGLSSWDRAAAGFWAYRSEKRIGENDEAHYWLEQAAKQPRSFYGFLAAHLLGQDAAKFWHMPELTAAKLAILTRRPAGWRAVALVQIGQPALAESELHHLNPQGRRDLQEAMLALAEKTKMPSLALQLGGIATNGDGALYDSALYPLPPWQPEQGFKVDRALMYALIRHESQFDPTAVSNRGACGLMQLMPSTANLVANSKVTGSDCSVRLMDPAFNMALGQKYVRHLARQPMIGDNLLLLLTAYNSGPTKMSRWIDDDTRNDPLLFIESMPVRETRDYVQQVLIHYWMYRARLAESEGSLTQMAHGEWPRTSLRDESPLLPHPKQAQAGGIEILASSER